MLRLDLDTKPGGVSARWRGSRGLTLHRRDGSLILSINAPYATDQELMLATAMLNQMLGNRNDTHPRTTPASAADTRDPVGDGAKA